MRKRSNLIYLFITSIFFTYCNLYYSDLIAHKLAFGWHFSSKILKISYAENTGAAFSILQNSTTLLIVLSVLTLIALFYYLFKNLEQSQKKDLFFISFMIAGILGNLYERIIFGYVRDFFDLTFINFPIFNISDIFINIGVLGIIILILLAKKPIKL